MNALSLQYLEQIVPIDEKATEFEVDGLKAPQVLNQFLLSFNRSLSKRNHLISLAQSNDQAMAKQEISISLMNLNMTRIGEHILKMLLKP